MLTYALSTQPTGFPQGVKWLPWYHASLWPYPHVTSALPRSGGTLASGAYADSLARHIGETYRGLVCHDFEGITDSPEDIAEAVTVADFRTELHGDVQHTSIGIAPQVADHLYDDPWDAAQQATARAMIQECATVYAKLWKQQSVITLGHYSGRVQFDDLITRRIGRMVTLARQVFGKNALWLEWAYRAGGWNGGVTELLPREVYKAKLKAAHDAGAKALVIWIDPDFPNPDWAWAEALAA